MKSELAQPPNAEQPPVGEVLTVELSNGAQTSMQITAPMLRMMAAPWAITRPAYEVALAVAAGQGMPELFQMQTVQPWGGAHNAPAVLTAERMERVRPHVLRREVAPLLEGTKLVEMRNGVAVIPLEGTILPKANLFTMLSGLTSLDMLALELAAAVRSDQVRAIVLDVDSPGGALAYTNEFAGIVRAANERKPVLAYTGNQMASAAFWIASAAREIHLDRVADVGSVGILMAVTRQTAEQKARRVVFVSSASPHKVNDPDTDEGRARLQAYVDALGELFVEVIAEHRGLKREAVLKIGGDVLIGQQAISAGFATALGSLEATIERARKLASNPVSVAARGVAFSPY